MQMVSFRGKKGKCRGEAGTEWGRMLGSWLQALQVAGGLCHFVVGAESKRGFPYLG